MKKKIIELTRGIKVFKEESELVKGVFLPDTFIISIEKEGINKEELKDKIQEEIDKIGKIWSHAEILDILDKLGYDWNDCSVSVLGEVLPLRILENSLFVDIGGDCCYTSEDLDWQYYYNGEKDLLEIEYMETVEVKDEPIDLDEWDGSNWSCGGPFCHAQLWIGVGENKGEFFLETWTQWIGDIAVVEVHNIDSLVERLKELERDPESYNL